MASSNLIPERTINFRVYNKGNDLLGVASVELPDIEAMSETVSGAGIAGEIESPTIGHYGPMSTTFTWRTIEKTAIELSTPGSHAVECRSSQQVFDAATGVYKTVPVRCSMRLLSKNIGLGSLEPGAQTESESGFEVTYIKLFVDKEPVLEIDKYNYVVKIGGQDILASVRADLGLQ